MADADAMLVGQKFAALRKFAGLQPTNVAKEADVERSTVGRVEGGKSKTLRLSTITKMVRACGWTRSQFFAFVESDLSAEEFDKKVIKSALNQQAVGGKTGLPPEGEPHHGGVLLPTTALDRREFKGFLDMLQSTLATVQEQLAGTHGQDPGVDASPADGGGAHGAVDRPLSQG